MKIGVIIGQLNPSLTGIGNYTYNLIKELNKLDADKDFLYLINYEHNRFFTNLKEVTINNPFKVLKTYAWYPFLVIKLRDHDLDVIHNPSQVPTFLKFKQKYIITIHDLTPFITPKESKFGRPLIYKLFFPRTLKTADKIIADSNSTKQDLIRYFNIPEEKIKVILLAADEKFKPLNNEEIDEFKQEYNLNFPFILYVGTLEARKNILTLIRAFYKLKKKNIHYKLVITGKKGWKYKEIFKTIDKLNLQNDIIFTGYVPEEDLPALYKAADLFVYPSIYEGFGLPPLEAMACGTPVITSNTSSLPEVVGDAGIMVDPYDVDGLARAMYKALTNERLRKEMTKKGLERAKMFSWEKCARETLEVYEEVYNER
jgi:glycosyltransferase involved in cell wall biosynthesis